MSKIKLAQMFLDIAEELDSEGYPEEAREADRFVMDLLSEENEDCAECDDLSSWISADPAMQMEPEEMVPEEMVSEVPAEFSDEEVTIVEEEPPLEEIPDPEPEFDKMNLEEFKSKIDSFLRFTDKGRKEAWTEVAGLAEKAIRHLEYGRKIMDEAHEILDERGEQIRFDIPFKW